MADSRPWSRLLVGIVLGGLVTGVFQFLLLERQHRHEKEKIKLTASQEYLSRKLEYRVDLYRKIRFKLYDALQDPNENLLVEALRSLANDLPFFQPKVETQIAVSKTKESLIYLLEELGKNPHDKTTLSQCKMLLGQLEYDFDMDIRAIEWELSHLGTKMSQID